MPSKSWKNGDLKRNIAFFLFKERPLKEQERRIKIPKESIVEVILGVKIPENDKEEILSFKEDYPVSKFYQMTMKDGKLIKNKI